MTALTLKGGNTDMQVGCQIRDSRPDDCRAHVAQQRHQNIERLRFNGESKKMKMSPGYSLGIS
jgi:hypothetical protein